MKLKIILLCGFVFLFGRNLAQGVVTAPFKSVNSKLNEMAPVLSPDGKALYFTIGNHPQNIGGIKDPGDIWVSLWIGGVWTTPKHGGPVINDAEYNGVAGFSADGSQLFLLGHYGKDGNSATTQGISVSRKVDLNWSAPENITIPYFLNRSKDFSGMINDEGNVFVFSAESYGSKGVEDIYVSLKNGSQWSEPINLGAQINTSSQEWSPSLSADGKLLYFSSNGRKGLGGFDVFVAARLDDSWKLWSSPQSEATVNSEGRELFYRQFKSMSLFTTTRNSDGYGDIRAVVDSIYRQPADTVIKILEVRYDVNSPKSKTVLVSGRVTHSKTGAGFKAKLSFKSDTTVSIVTAADGRYRVSIPSTKIYNIEVQASGFVNLSERLDIHTFELKTLEMNFKLQPIEVGAVVNLKNILFYMGTTNLLEESYPELDVVVTFLTQNPKVEIELEGHTDNRGDAKKNLVLSQQRVDKIKAYLVSKGINHRRIKGKGIGGARPIATSDTEDARKLNRRVEFIIVKD
jgi:outer membrane protein OmpA-like peptidoglycan-associated protein